MRVLELTFILISLDRKSYIPNKFDVCLGSIINPKIFGLCGVVNFDGKASFSQLLLVHVVFISTVDLYLVITTN